MAKNWISIDKQHIDELSSLCKPMHYRKVSATDIPSFIPEHLRHKCISATIMASGVENHDIFYVVNLHRCDGEDIDQQPLCLIASPQQSASGYFYQHGSWDGRTTKMSPDMVDIVSASGVSAASEHLPIDTSGTLSDLLGRSDLNAFDAASRRLLDKRPWTRKS